MSTFATIRNLVDEDYGAHAVAARTATTASAATDQEPAAPVALTKAGVLERITQFIPSEGIVFFLTGLALAKELGSDAVATGVIALGLGLLAVAVIGVISYRVIPKSRKRDRAKVTAATFVTVGLFAVYTTILPGNLFEAFDWWKPAIGTVLALIVTTLAGIYAPKK